MAPLSVLFVTTRFPHPIYTGDRVRAYHQVRLLARRHRVTLACFDAADGEHAGRREMDACCARVITEPFDRAAAAWRLARHAWSDTPLQVAMYGAGRLRQRVMDAVSQARFDVLHVQLARALPLVEGLDTLPRVVDLVDALSMNMHRRAKGDRAPWRWAARVDARRLAAYERRVCRDAHTITVVASADREVIGEFPNLRVNANGVDLGEFPFSAAPRPLASVVFTGNLGYYPNVEAACWLAHTVMPVVWRARPEARLTLAGARPHRRVLALARHDPRVEVAGFVAHMREPLSAARVAMAPMRSGSGQLLKVLEAMAVGTPVVATPEGLSGIDAVHGEHAMIGEDATTLAAHVLRLFDDEDLAGRLARNGRALVERCYTWEHSVEALEALYRAVAAPAPAPAGA